MTFQHWIQHIITWCSQNTVKVVEPHENNLEVLNVCSWATSGTAKLLWKYLEICVVICRAMLKLQGTRGKLDSLVFP